MTLTLREVTLFSHLSDQELGTLQPLLKEKSFKKGEMLFFEGRPCERIIIVQSGRVKIYKTSLSGREQILEILEAGDTCACHPGSCTWVCSSAAEALTTCKVWSILRKDFHHLVQSNPVISPQLNSLFAEKIKKYSCLIEDVSLKDVKARLVKFLLDMKEAGAKPTSNGGVEPIAIPFTREEIASRLGTSRETVARTLSHLKEEGLISLHPHAILILDRKNLEKMLT